mmetsp:Transcript_10822/g.34801  ORF Transcript_10822/g.34801 Transcript_10822/m.34801 type:complete len:209 (-) Transcript_10822:1929-2555(-)
MQQQVLDALGALALERVGPEVAGQRGELLGEGQDLQLEHELEREEGVVLDVAHQLEQGGGLVVCRVDLRRLHLWLVCAQLRARQLLEGVGALGGEELSRGGEGVAHESPTHDGPLGPVAAAAKGGAAAAQPWHVADAHAAELAPMLDLESLQALEENGNVVAGDVVADDDVGIDVVDAPHQEAEEGALVTHNLEIQMRIQLLISDDAV